jgi:hypothetical protein
MKKYAISMIIASAALAPSAAFAQTSCEQQHSNRVVGTVAGAGIGALLGSAIAGRGDRTVGAIAGAVGGGVIGNQITKGSADCAHAYGYYDRDNHWHATGNDRAMATGYYDRDGGWVDGAPNGYYTSQGSWQAAADTGAARGYYDDGNRWVPSGETGYYDNAGQWSNAKAAGHYDQRGQWVDRREAGYYDRAGVWQTGNAPGHRDSDGRWINDAATGYYGTDGRWNAGSTTGFYDGRGRWISTSAQVSSGGRDYGRDQGMSDRPHSVRDQINWLNQRIQMSIDRGTINRYGADRLTREVRMIDWQERNMAHRGGNLSQRDDATIQRKLDSVKDRLAEASNQRAR